MSDATFKAVAASSGREYLPVVSSLRPLTLVFLLTACSADRSDEAPSRDSATADTGAKLDATRESATPDSTLDTGTADEAEVGDPDAGEDTGVDTGTPPKKPILTTPICGTPGCSGTIEEGTTCKTIVDWYASADKKCKTKGLVMTYFEIGTPCSIGGKSAKYSCCPAGTSTLPIAASALGCPPRADTWPVGTPCTGARAGLICNYPNACGVVDDWHCKSGWEPNTTCGCF